MICLGGRKGIVKKDGANKGKPYVMLVVGEKSTDGSYEGTMVKEVFVIGDKVNEVPFPECVAKPIMIDEKTDFFGRREILSVNIIK